MSRPGPFNKSGMDAAYWQRESEARLRDPKFRDMNENHDPHNGQFSSGEGGSSGSAKGGSGISQLTSGEYMDYTDTVSSISDKVDAFNSKAEDLSNATSTLKDAIDSLNNHEVDDDNGDSQATAFDNVKETASALEEFVTQADAMAKSAANASKGAKETLAKFKEHMKEHGVA